jgi:hypothetical protein
VGGASPKKKAILERLAQRPSPARLDEAEFAALLDEFAPISERSLRKILRGSGVPLAPLVEGVRQDSFEDLERTLLAILAEYEAAGENRERRRACRRAVIRAKDHARLALGKLTGERRKAKEEMILWMLEWLENPGLFPDWLKLRKRHRSEMERQNLDAPK